LVLNEEEVRKSFARVKEDILQVKRSLNKQLFSVEGMGKTLSSVLPKEEFYAFVQRLGSRIEELENAFVSKSNKGDVEELVSELRKEITATRKVVERREDIADELRQVRLLKGKLLELEGMAVFKPDFSKELAKLKLDLSQIKSASAGGSSGISSVRSSLSGLEKELTVLSSEVSGLKSSSSNSVEKVASLSSSLSRLEKNLTALASKLNSVSASAATKEGLAAFTGSIESSHQETQRGFSSLKRSMDRKLEDVDKRMSMLDSVEEKLASLAQKLSETETVVAGLNENASRKFADKKAFEKSIAELRAKLSELQHILESSIHEVSIEDYVTKRSLKQQLASLSESLSSSLTSLKRETESSFNNAEKQLEAEVQKFAPSKEIKKLREEIGKLSSGMVPVENFNSRLDKLQDSTSAATDEFKAEIRKQKEMFEDKLKSLESGYRDAHNSMKSELDDVRSQLKGLAKADAEAKSEIAKVSVSASKAAAKTATEIVEEIETESGGKRGKGVSPLVISIIIAVLFVAGSVAYVVFHGPGIREAAQDVLPVIINSSSLVPQVPANETVPANVSQNISQPVENISTTLNESGQVPATPSNVSETINATITNATTNVTIPINETPVVNATEVNVTVINTTVANATVDLNQSCKDRLECTRRADGEYWFDCYFDPVLNDCRCYVSSVDNCPSLGLGNQTAPQNVSAGETQTNAKSQGIQYYAIVAFVILVVAFFAYRTLFSKEGKNGNQKKPEQKSEKPKAEKAEKESKGQSKGKDEEKGEGVIDLEEFFEKKDSKKE